jgi:hypothetical protein
VLFWPPFWAIWEALRRVEVWDMLHYNMGLVWRPVFWLLGA